jgi:hypothetical protein
VVNSGLTKAVGEESTSANRRDTIPIRPRGREEGEEGGEGEERGEAVAEGLMPFLGPLRCIPGELQGHPCHTIRPATSQVLRPQNTPASSCSMVFCAIQSIITESKSLNPPYYAYLVEKIYKRRLNE